METITWICRCFVFYLFFFLLHNGPLTDKALAYWYITGAIVTFIGMGVTSWMFEKKLPAAVAKHLVREPMDHFDTSDSVDVFLTSLGLALTWPVFGVGLFFIFSLLEIGMLFSHKHGQRTEIS